MVARGRRGRQRRCGTGVVGAAAGHCAPSRVVACGCDGVLRGLRRDAGADLHVVNQQVVHVSAVVVAEGHVNRLPGIGAQVNILLHPRVGGGAAVDGRQAGEIANGIACGAHIHAVVLTGIVGIQTFSLPLEVHLAAGGQDEGGGYQPVVGSQRTRIVVVGSRSQRAVAVVAQRVRAVGGIGPGVAVAVTIVYTPAPKSVDILEVLSVGEGRDVARHRLGEHTLHHERAEPVATVQIKAGTHQTACIHARVIGESRGVGDIGCIESNPHVLRGCHRGRQGDSLPLARHVAAHHVRHRGGSGLAVAAGVDSDIVRAGLIGIEHHRRQLLAGVKQRGREHHAPMLVAAKTVGRQPSVAVAVAHRIGGDGGIRGGEAVAAAVGHQVARVVAVAVVPAVEAVAVGSRGHNHHSVAVSIGAALRAVVVVAAAHHHHRSAAGRASLHRGGDRGIAGGAPRRVGTQANEHIVVEVVGAHVGTGAAAGRLQAADGIVVVKVSTPAPVDMEVAAVVIAVKHKAVSTRLVAALVEQRTALVKLGAQALAVIVVAVVVTAHHGHIGAVLEILHQRMLRRRTHRAAVHVVRTAGFRTVGHLVGNADVVHQGGHGVDLCRRACRRQGVGHLRPLVGRGAEVGRKVVVSVLRAVHVTAAAVGVAAVARGGVVVVLHHLRRGRGHTARHRARCLAAVGGAQGVVVGALVPRGGQQRSHGSGQHRLRGRAVHQALPLLGQDARLAAGLGARGIHLRDRLHMGLPPAYLFVVALQEATHMLRHALGLEAVDGAVGQHGLHTVVAADEHEAPLRGCKDIELRKRSLLRNILQRSNILHALRLHPVLRHSTRHILRHRVGHSHAHQCHQEGNHTDFFHIG